MKLLVFSCYANGEYSGAEYTERIVIPAEAFDNLSEEAKHEIENLIVLCGDLDGKHSNVCTDIQLFYLEESKLFYISEYQGSSEINMYFELKRIGFKTNMYFELKRIFDENDVILRAEMRKAKKYMDSLDLYVTRGFKIRRSQVELVEEFVKSLQDREGETHE